MFYTINTIQLLSSSSTSLASNIPPGNLTSYYDKFEAKSRHWSEKSLEEMTDRDWRIFKEDFDIRVNILYMLFIVCILCVLCEYMCYIHLPMCTAFWPNYIYYTLFTIYLTCILIIQLYTYTHVYIYLYLSYTPLSYPYPQIQGGRATNPLRYWSEAHFPPEINKGIKDAGYETPSPIQRQAVPIGLSGRDIIGIAETGSGKVSSLMHMSIFVLNYVCDICFMMYVLYHMLIFYSLLSYTLILHIYIIIDLRLPPPLAHIYVQTTPLIYQPLC